MLNSAIYLGWVGHRRFMPVEHNFRYRLFMMYMDLDELPDLFSKQWLWSLNRGNIACFRRSDYLGDSKQPLKVAVQELLERETGHASRGPIRLLTHMRYFGFCFNPVSFYYCFEADGITLQAIITEITNTPWNERHTYVLNCTHNAARLQTFQFSKDFHISPFMPMNIEYDWAFNNPTEKLSVYMRNLQRDGKVFDATLEMRRQPITSKNLAWVLLSYPFMTLWVVISIYWQALCLWLKRVPIFTHPHKLRQHKQRETI